MQNGDTSSWERAVVLVDGYHEHTYPMPFAYENNLQQRFAIVISAYKAGSTEALFDAELFLAFVEALQGSLEYDRLSIYADDEDLYSSFHEMQGTLQARDESERDAPIAMAYFKELQPVCVMQTEYWVRCGGPEFYQDSYTFSFYMANNRFDEFRAVCREVAAKYQAALDVVVHEPRENKPYCPWYRRPLTLMGFRPWRACFPPV